MKVGDLVMWIGKDSDHGAIGVIAKAPKDHSDWGFEVVWSDQTVGEDLWGLDLMALDDAPER